MLVLIKNWGSYCDWKYYRQLLPAIEVIMGLKRFQFLTDETSFALNTFKVMDQPLFFLAVIKYGIEYETLNED